MESRACALKLHCLPTGRESFVESRRRIVAQSAAKASGARLHFGKTAYGGISVYAPLSSKRLVREYSLSGGAFAVEPGEGGGELGEHTTRDIQGAVCDVTPPLSTYIHLVLPDHSG